MMKETLSSQEISMNSTPFHSRLARSAGLWVAACCLAAAQAHAQTPSPPAAAASAGMAAGQMQHGGMSGDMKGMQGGMPNMHASGDTDKDFAMNMKMHHQKAVEMSKMQLENGKSPEMKKMAKQIIAAQNKEIARFDQWLAKHK